MGVRLHVIVDVANVVGSRPDGWWKDRAGAATRLLIGMAHLPGKNVTLHSGLVGTVGQVSAVLEGAAKSATGPADVTVILAARDGDTTIAHTAHRATERGETVLVVTADRGLRQRLPRDAYVAGPGWLNSLLGR